MTDLVTGDFDTAAANVGFTALVNLDDGAILRADLHELGLYTGDGYRAHRHPLPLMPAYSEILEDQLAEAVEFALELRYPAGPGEDPRDYYQEWADDLCDQP